MSVLNNPVTPDISPAQRVADRIRQQTRMTYQQLVNAFNQGAQSFWRNPQASPAEIAAALGTDAKEIFELHGKIGALLASVKPEAIAAGSSVVGEFSYNADGTVTVADPTPPVA